MRAEIVEQLCAGAPDEMVAGARALVVQRGNLADQLVALGFAARDVLEACSDVTGLPLADPSWLDAPRPPPTVDGLDPILCRRLQAAPVAAMGGRLCIAYADPEMAVQHRDLGLPPHAPYLALSNQLWRALALLPDTAPGLTSSQLAPTADNAIEAPTTPAAIEEDVPSTEFAPPTMKAYAPRPTQAERPSARNPFPHAVVAPASHESAPTMLAPGPRVADADDLVLDVESSTTDIARPPHPVDAATGPTVPVSNDPTAIEMPPAASAVTPEPNASVVAPPVPKVPLPPLAKPAMPPAGIEAAAGAAASGAGKTPVARGPQTSSRPRGAPEQNSRGISAPVLTLLVLVGVIAFVVVRQTRPTDLGVAARLRTHAAPASGPALTQHELIMQSVALADPAQAIALLTKAIDVGAHGPEERDAYLERARRELDRTRFDEAEGDLLVVARRPDRAQVEAELEGLLDAVATARARHKRDHPERETVRR